MNLASSDMKAPSGATLASLVNSQRTDKNTTHSYLELYQELLQKRKDTARNVLEVGIGFGGSIKLWYDYFINAKIYGVDMMTEATIWPEIKNKGRIGLYTSQDAYDENFVKKTFKDLKFDVLLDDGPHTLESMVKFIQLYLPLLADDGILIIEDVQDISWCETLKNTVPEELQKYVKVYDRRAIKGRYDDIVFTLDKSPVQKDAKNVVIITSVIECNSKVTVYSKEERIKQTLKGITTVREKIPNSFIIFLDLQDYENIRNLVDKYILITNKELFTANTKQIGDFLLFKSGLENLPNNIIIKNIFKMSGRYWLNDTFEYAEYDNEKDCFRVTDPEIWKNTVTTCFFKIAYKNLENIKNFLNGILEYFIYLLSLPPVETTTNIEFTHELGKGIIPLIQTESKIGMEQILYVYSIMNSTLHMHNLGVSGLIAINGVKGSA